MGWEAVGKKPKRRRKNVVNGGMVVWWCGWEEVKTDGRRFWN